MDIKEKLQSAEKKLQELVEYKQSNFSPNIDQIIKPKVQEILQLIPSDFSVPGWTASLKAKSFYLRGATIDCLSEYSKEADESLSKAVKLDPSLIDAWNCLGNCFCKKNDLKSALNCYETAQKMVNC